PRQSTADIAAKHVTPLHKVGAVDVYQVTHPGIHSRNHPMLINTVTPRVAVFNNGPQNGCHPTVTSALRRSPDIQAIYQLHRNLTVGAQENTDPDYIANPDEKCQGETIRLSVAADGKSYQVQVG